MFPEDKSFLAVVFPTAERLKQLQVKGPGWRRSPPPLPSCGPPGAAQPPMEELSGRLPRVAVCAGVCSNMALRWASKTRLQAYAKAEGRPLLIVNPQASRVAQPAPDLPAALEAPFGRKQAQPHCVCCCFWYKSRLLCAPRPA